MKSPLLALALPAVLVAAPRAPQAKVSAEAQAARQALQGVLDSVHAAWFGKPYQALNALDVQGSMQIDVSAAAITAKANALSQGQARVSATRGGSARLGLKGTYFANGDFRTETSGDFSLLYYRVGNRGFLYSKDLNAYTTRVEPPPSDAPLSYFGWFRQCLNDIKAAYVDGPVFKASLGREENRGGRVLQTLVFEAPTGAYDARKREQSLAETLGFWKRGRLELVYDKAKRQPVQMDFRNEAQGVHTRMTFAYGAQDRLERVEVDNRSRGMEGPASLQVSYGGDGLMSHLSGQLNGKDKKVAFDLKLGWGRDRRSSSIVSVPPPGATKRGREELETGLLVKLAGNMLELQRAGLNLRSVPLGGKR